MPRLDAGDGPIGALYAQALARAADLYDATAGPRVLSRGALQLETEPKKDAGRFDRVARRRAFRSRRGRNAFPRRSSPAGSVRPLACDGLFFRDARVVDPTAILEAWLGEAGAALPVGIARRHRGQAACPDGGSLTQQRPPDLAPPTSSALAAGMGCQALAPELPLTPSFEAR